MWHVNCWTITTHNGERTIGAKDLCNLQRQLISNKSCSACLPRLPNLNPLHYFLWESLKKILSTSTTIYKAYKIVYL